MMEVKSNKSAIYSAKDNIETGFTVNEIYSASTYLLNRLFCVYICMFN